MDKGLKHEKMCQVLKTEHEKHSSSRQAVLTNQWDPVESDTESLAQERVYRQQLQMCIDQIKHTLPQKEMTADSLQHGDGEVDDDDDGSEDLQVYDSLEVGAHLRAKRTPTVSLTEYVDTQTDEREGTSSQLISDDAYSDLRYDPNWRTNLKGAGRFNESPQISVKEYYQVPKETSSQACGDRLALVMKGGYRYIVDTGPAAVVTPHAADDHSDQPYHLHPQDGQDSSITSPHCHNRVLKLRSPEVDLSRPSRERDNISQRGVEKKCEKYIGRSPELTEEEEYKTCYQQELRHPRGGPSETQHMSTSTLSSPKVLPNNKVERLTEDIVERNKITLGRNTSKGGSYATVHALKQDMPHDVNKVHETLKETASTESQEDSSDPKLRWLQKTQQLKVAQISKGKKAQRKYPTPPQQQKPPIPGIGAERVDCLSSPLARPAAVIPPKPQKMTPSQPLAPTFHLNINLDASLLPLLQQKTQDAVINVAPLHGPPHWTPASDVDLALSPGYIQTNPGKYSQMSQKGLNAQLHHQNLESSPEQCDLSSWDPSDEVQFQQNFPRTPTTTSSPASGSYTVLPPIGKPMTGTEAELSPGQTVNAACIHRSSSDGYLVQMEKQKQLRTRVTYKAYSLKDYKQLRSDINLRGLGPDYKAIEKTAEKMKRQRLYSNVIREQNKKISRIPFLPAKDPEGNDKKVPRMKALEYAKTIAKPPVQRQKHQSEGFTEHAPYLEELDMSEPVSLEVLRKRHEEEKKAVAVLRKVHAV